MLREKVTILEEQLQGFEERLSQDFERRLSELCCRQEEMTKANTENFDALEQKLRDREHSHSVQRQHAPSAAECDPCQRQEQTQVIESTTEIVTPPLHSIECGQEYDQEYVGDEGARLAAWRGEVDLKTRPAPTAGKPHSRETPRSAVDGGKRYNLRRRVNNPYSTK